MGSLVEPKVVALNASRCFWWILWITPNKSIRGARRQVTQNKSSSVALRGRKQIPRTIIWNLNSEPNPFGPRSNQFDNTVYQIFQTAELGNQITSSAGAETDFAQYFNINLIPGISNYLACFDQYWIKQMEVAVTPSSSTAINVDNFRWLCAVDYDDANTPTFAALSQYSNVSDNGRTEGCYKVFVPHMAIGVSNNSSLSSSRNVPSSWIDSANTGVAHYGIKVSMNATTTTVVLAFRVRMLIAFRNAI
jgi:hypothetical protein